MNSFFTAFAAGGFLSHLGIGPHLLTFLFIVAAIWNLAWKGVALWFAARNHQKKWFVLLLILNTVGIAEIIYLLWFRRDKQEGVTQSLFNNPLPDPEEDEEVALKTQA